MSSTRSNGRVGFERRLLVTVVLDVICERGGAGTWMNQRMKSKFMNHRLFLASSPLFNSSSSPPLASSIDLKNKCAVSDLDK